MDPLANMSAFERAWQSTLDSLQKHIEDARHIPDWAMAVVATSAMVLGAVACLAASSCCYMLMIRGNNVRLARRPTGVLLADADSNGRAHTPGDRAAGDDDL